MMHDNVYDKIENVEISEKMKKFTGGGGGANRTSSAPPAGFSHTKDFGHKKSGRCIIWIPQTDWLFFTNC